MKRRLLFVFFTGLLAFLPFSILQAEETKLHFAAYGGSTEKLFKELILPDFEKKYNVRIIYVAGNSTTNLARLESQRKNPDIDVVILDDGPMYQAIDRKLCQVHDSSPYLANVYGFAPFPNNKAVGIGVIGTGIAYNTDYFNKQGWKPPQSWKDLSDKKYEGKLSIPPITNTYGLHALLMFAKINGGSENNINPGFDYIISNVEPNILTFEPSSGKMSELFQNGEIVISVWGSGRIKSLADTGFPVAYAEPSEGAVLLMTAACKVQDSDQPELADKLINYLLSEKVQKLLAVHKAWSPTNKNVKLTQEEAQNLPYGEAMTALHQVDWDVVNEKRKQWTKTWNRTIEK